MKRQFFSIEHFSLTWHSGLLDRYTTCTGHTHRSKLPIRLSWPALRHHSYNTCVLSHNGDQTLVLVCTMSFAGLMIEATSVPLSSALIRRISALISLRRLR